MNIAKGLIFIGAGLIIVGVLIWVFSKLGTPVGRLPGDIRIQAKRYRLYAPLVTSLLISLALTIVLNIAFWMFKK